MLVPHRGAMRLPDVLALVGLLGAIAILVVLYLPRGNGGGRRNTCANNMRNVGFALIQYEANHKGYPGYANTIGGRTASFVVPILPYLERQDLLRAWEEGLIPFQQLAAIHLEILTCPNDPTENQTTGPLSYVVNAGEATHQRAANGVFHDHTKANPVAVSNEYISKHDGTAYTLLVSENVQAEKWAVTDATKAKLWTTFVWHRAPVPRNAPINAGKDPQEQPIQPVESLEYARPSSYHPGGVNVYFCGGNSRFLNDDIDYKVYRQLMTPNSAESDDPDKVELGDDDF